MTRKAQSVTTAGRFRIYQTDASTILARTSGFIAAAGFTHSLTPARNCTFGCLYCYVPTLRVFGGLKRDDWNRWGQHTTLKANAIYCSPRVDPYQPAEEVECGMPAILDAAINRPPRVGEANATRGGACRQAYERTSTTAGTPSREYVRAAEDARDRYVAQFASLDWLVSTVRTT